MRRLPVAAAALALWMGPSTPGLALQVFEQILVKVNGDLLTRRQLDERVRSVLAQEQGRAIPAADLRTDPALRQQAAAVTPTVVAGGRPCSVAVARTWPSAETAAVMEARRQTG